MLLPAHHPSIRVSESDGEIEVRFEDRRWVFPREDCVVLPIENTTAELIAHWIGGRLRDVIAAADRGNRLRTLQVEVEENFGQSATFRLHC